MIPSFLVEVLIVVSFLFLCFWGVCYYQHLNIPLSVPTGFGSTKRTFEKEAIHDYWFYVYCNIQSSLVLSFFYAWFVFEMISRIV